MSVIRSDFGNITIQIALGSRDDTITGRDARVFDTPPPENPPINIIYAGAGNDTVDAGFGNDVVFGGAGNDRIAGHGGGGPSRLSELNYATRFDGNDFLDGGTGDDFIQGGGGDDTVIGGAGNDDLHGSDGSDILLGGAGDDTLRPGSEADILTGGAGADTFVFAYSIENIDSPDLSDGRDVITDFRSGTDVIDLRGYFVSEDELTVAQTEAGLLLSFDFLSPGNEVLLSGVEAVQPGDILFA